MDLHLIFHNSFQRRSFFEMTEGSRRWHMLLILTAGTCSVRFDGKEHIAGADEILFFPKNTPFTRRVITPIGFHQVGFLAEDEAMLQNLPAGRLNIPKGHVRALTEYLDETALTLPKNANDIFLHAVKTVILEYNIFNGSAPMAEGARDPDIAFMLSYFSEHLAEKISIEELADEVHLSHVGLIWKCKRHVGCTPSELLCRMRLQYAKQLLLEGKMKVNEIAALCGYQNAYYFSNAFRKHYGISPTGFRDRMSGEADGIC
ncbi:MAG: helix-turn-helix transcriptional regulator [Ruminococcaceae bacterium]|nr:helix-turn-helix transcriptional regulator [Oscillospiraceae bacterium]